jgi:glycosyltransferase involved in cell wall biosynthesis
MDDSIGKLLTIVLPTKNEAGNIRTFLESVPAELPLVVVDAGSDETTAIIGRERPSATLISHPGHIAAARQLGAVHARTPWLLFTDGDVTFAPDYFDRLPALLRGDAVYGAKRSHEAYAGYYRWFTRGQQLMQWIGIPGASGSNMLIRREAWLACGGFDLALTVNEDSEIFWRLHKMGFAVHFAPELTVFENDHRRLQQGMLRKTVHSILRGFLLYFDLMPARWRSSDWGYWSHPRMDPPPLQGWINEVFDDRSA